MQQQQQPVEFTFVVTKNTPYRNNIMIPQWMDIGGLEWKKIKVEYRPKLVWTQFGGHQTGYIEPYQVTAYAYLHKKDDGDYLILRPIRLQQNDEFQEIFGKHDRMQKLLTQTRKFPIIKIDGQQNYTVNMAQPYKPRQSTLQIKRLIHQIKKQYQQKGVQELQKLQKQEQGKYTDSIISLHLFTEPVSWTSPNKPYKKTTFEYDDIKKWLRLNQRHPSTNEKMTIDQLVPDQEMSRQIIRKLKQIKTKLARSQHASP